MQIVCANRRFKAQNDLKNDSGVCKRAINRFIFCKQGLKEDREEHVQVAPNLFSLCSSNKIQASFPMDEIINSWGQTAPSSVSLFMANGERARE